MTGVAIGYILDFIFEDILKTIVSNLAIVFISLASQIFVFLYTAYILDIDLKKYQSYNEIEEYTFIILIAAGIAFLILSEFLCKLSSYSKYMKKIKWVTLRISGSYGPHAAIIPSNPVELTAFQKICGAYLPMLFVCWAAWTLGLLAS